MSVQKNHSSLIKAVLTVCLIICCVQANAQFNMLSGEKSSTRWSEINSTNYWVIYPRGLDSLGLKYSTLLEYYHPLVGKSVGYMPNQSFESALPVVLHPYAPVTNGMVALAPRRMEVFTFSDPYSQLPPLPWENLLSIHENRHAAQLEFAVSGFWREFRKIFGEVAPLTIDGLYFNLALAEGDAVVAETALTNSGRGRTADFLAYYRMAFDNGDYRNWYRWRYGSLRHYTPDYYTVGYMTVAGTRYLYDAPMFMSEYLRAITNPFRFNAMNSVVRSFSGQRLKQTWREIENAFESEWKELDRQRGPFQQTTPSVDDNNTFYKSYRGTVQIDGGDLMSVRSAMDKAAQLVRISPDGNVTPVRPFSADSKLAYSAHTGCIYWSEAIQDIRFELHGTSRIRMMNTAGNRITDFTESGRYVNPAVSDDGLRLACVEYPLESGCRIVLFSLDDRTELKSFDVPGLQVNELAFSGNYIVFNAISDAGMGLYLTDMSSMVTLENPAPFKVRSLISNGGNVYFTSDKNGTSEVYSYTLAPAAAGLLPQGGTMVQLTNTRYGASDPYFCNGELCFSELQPEGRIPVKADAPYRRQVSFADRVSYPIADALSAQETRLAVNRRQVMQMPPENYSKALNALYLHSWVPLYVNTDGIQGSMTGYGYERASLGVTAFFQNLTNTFSGRMGISIHPDPFYQLKLDEHDLNDKKTRVKTSTGFHTTLDYTGLLPKISLTFDIGDRHSAKTVYGISSLNDSIYTASAESDKKGVYVGGSAIVSVPLVSSHSGWVRRLNPFAGVLASTDQLGEGYRAIKYNETWDVYEPDEPLTGGMHTNIRYIAGLTGGIERPVAQSAIYPRLGIGGGIQYSQSPFAKSVYASLYCYLPGLTSIQGLKLQAELQSKRQMAGTTAADVWGFNMFDLTPRGFNETGFDALFKLYSKDSYKLSADYAIPMLSLDMAFRQYAYLRNLELVPFADYAVSSINGSNYDIYSVGADVLFRFEKFLVMNNTLRMGLRLSHNGGSICDRMGVDEPFTVRLVTGINL